MKVNYILNEDEVISGYITHPFDETKPFVEVNSTSDIFIGHSKVEDGKIVNTITLAQFISQGE